MTPRYGTIPLTIPLALGLCSCLDLATPPPRPAVLSVSIEIDDRRSLEVQSIEAVLSPGNDERARERSVTDSTLRVAGLSLRPIGIDERGGFVYRDSIAIDPAMFQGEVVVVEPPTVASILEVAPPIVTRTIWRAGSEALVLTVGEDLVLDLAVPLLADDAGPVSEQWRLTLSDERGFALDLIARGPPPTTLRLPSALFEQASPGELGGLLRFTRANLWIAAERDYVVSVLVLVTLQWLIEIQLP